MATSAASLKKFNNFGEIANFIWSNADLLRGDYKRGDYVIFAKNQRKYPVIGGVR